MRKAYAYASHVLNWILLVVLILAITYASKLSFHSDTRWFQSNDPSISLDHKPSQTIPTWALYLYGYGVVPVIILAYTPCLSKMQDNNRGGNLWGPFTYSIHIVYTYLQGFVFLIACVQLGKNFADSLRPDFLDRCQLSSTATPVEGTGRASTYTIADCTGDAALVLEGRRSFPSTHCANLFYAGVTLAFLFYTVHIRPLLRTGEDVHCWRFLWTFLPVFVACIGAATRLGDNCHRVADVCVGAVMGALTALVVATWAHRRFTPHLDLPPPDVPLLSKDTTLSA